MRKLLLVLLLLAMACTFAQAVQIAMVDSSQYASGVNNQPWGEPGHFFRTGSTAKEATMFGFIDVDNDGVHGAAVGPDWGDGLESDVTVSLWDYSTSTLVASAVVPQGTGALLVDNYRYVAISGGPVTLAANKDYILSFNSCATLDFCINSIPMTFNSSWVGTNDSTTWGSGFSATPGACPDVWKSWNAGKSYGGANIIPEPVTVMLLGFGAIGAIVRRKK